MLTNGEQMARKRISEMFENKSIFGINLFSLIQKEFPSKKVTMIKKLEYIERRTGISKYVLLSYLSGRRRCPREENMKKLAEFFGVKIDKFFKV